MADEPIDHACLERLDALARGFAERERLYTEEIRRLRKQQKALEDTRRLRKQLKALEQALKGMLDQPELTEAYDEMMDRAQQALAATAMLLNKE